MPDTQTTNKVVGLKQLETYDGLIKQVIATESGKAFKDATVEGTKIKFYKTLDHTDTPKEIDLPADALKDWFFDVTQAGVVNEFEWSDTLYPGSTNPNLDGKPVVVFALSKGTTTQYSFASLEALVDVYTGEDSTSATTTVNSTTNKIKTEVKISTKEGNSLSIDPDNGGLYVSAQAPIDFATEADINAMFPSTP